MIFAAIADRNITHIACAPVVLYMLLNHPDRSKRDAARKVTVATGGASPTSALIAEMSALGFDLIHLYGLTESYGPATMRLLSDEERKTPLDERARLLSRQGTRHPTASRLHVLDQEGRQVAGDGETVGEICLCGNTLMQGYYRDPSATEHAFDGGLFHTGDLAVVHPNGDIEIKDRSKDVIISGGENISSLEVESVLHQHPAVLMAAVVAAPDPKWGEIPVAFIETRAGMSVAPDELVAFCRGRMAGFKLPRRIFFQELPKTTTGKIQKFLLRGIAADGSRCRVEESAMSGASAEQSSYFDIVAIDSGPVNPLRPGFLFEVNSVSWSDTITPGLMWVESTEPVNMPFDPARA